MVLGTAVAGLTCLADVTSANIVGYTGKTLVAGKYNMISLPFAGVAKETQKLTEAMTGSNWNFGEYADTGDNLKVWDPINDYTTYYYYEDDSHEYDGWYNFAGDTYFDDCDENIGGLEAGWCAWYLSRGDKAPVINMSGAVEGSDDVQMTIQDGLYNLIVNPFPVNFQPNSNQPWWEGEKQVDWGNATFGDFADTADNIKIWDPINDYDTYYYYEDDSHEYDGWYNFAGDTYFEDVAGNENGIPAGTPFWYLSRGTKGNTHKVTFFNPTK